MGVHHSNIIRVQYRIIVRCLMSQRKNNLKKGRFWSYLESEEI